MIPVTKTFFPSIEEYVSQLNRIWENGWITNRGNLVLELERKLKEYLQVPKIIATNNGTVPLQIALKLLGVGGEIITTPFPYVATTAAIVWENCTPVFVDIHPEYFTIDETKIKAAITSRTTAILATHVFGNPCDVEAINLIAEKHKLKVIYDAAHCFGVKYKGQSIFNYGDVSTCSFHATKLFHTGEGGAMFCKDEELFHQLFYSHNFGHNGHTDFWGLGINGKISELQAAIGLAVFNHLEYIFSKRKDIVDFYNARLNFKHLQKLKIRDNTEWNYSYFPVVFESEEKLLKKTAELNANNIFPRRYYYPSLNTLSYTNKKAMPIAESVASRIICLPLYTDLKEQEQVLITDILTS